MSDWISKVDLGTKDEANSKYTDRIAKVRIAPTGQYELFVRSALSAASRYGSEKARWKSVPASSVITVLVISVSY